MTTGRRRLLWALLVSGLIHAAWLVDLDWHSLILSPAPDQVLASRKPAAIKRVRLAATPARRASEVMQVTLLGNLDATVVVTTPAPRKLRPHPKPTQSALSPPLAAAATDNPNTISDTTPSASATPEQPPAPVVEPAPTFPVSVIAEQRASYYGLSMDLRQQWSMEGDSYVIHDNASKFGFTAELTSEGRISADGLQPSRFRLLLNHDVKSYADFDREGNQLIHGKASARKISALTSDMQDMASLPFHVAVTWEGTQDRKIMVTTGNAVYEILLHAEAEEVIRLPGGDLRTLHLSGRRTSEDGGQQAGYDIWLAPDLRNFPVRFRGPDSKGNLIDMSVLSLRFDGKPVFGKAARALPLPPPDPEDVPDNLRSDHELLSPAPVPEIAPADAAPVPATSETAPPSA